MFSLHLPACMRQREQGFTLVEIMVAMAIGMLGIVIIMQMSLTFEGQKRTTTGGDDALNAGAIALYGLEQNIQQAGYCFSPTPPTLSGATLAPVTINLTAINSLKDANTDTIMVAYGNDACQPVSASGVAAAATLNVLAYAVINGNLMQCDYLANNCANAPSWVQIASGFVSMKAECSGSQGVRVALVTRSSQLEKTAVTAAVPAWSGTGAIVLPTTGYDAGFGWQNYRYKTFETVVPIRNTLWSGAQGC